MTLLIMEDGKLKIIITALQMSKFLLILHPKPLNKVMEKVETSHPAELNFCLYSYSSVIY